MGAKARSIQKKQEEKCPNLIKGGIERKMSDKKEYKLRQSTIIRVQKAIKEHDENGTPMIKALNMFNVSRPSYDKYLRERDSETTQHDSQSVS